MARLSTRLSAVEARLRPKPKVLRGTFELHYTEAWPDCRDFPELACQHCSEHGPNCAALVTPTSEPFRRLIVLTGVTAGPGMGLD
jgi:hypothetical protein